jgi:signal transduction histidine kinase
MNELREYFQAQLLLQKKENILEFELHPELEPKEFIIITDLRNLRQIFNKLISNAVKFTYQGKIELWCKKSSPDELLFMVHDTGIGIPPEKKDVVFVAFRQGEETRNKKITEGSGIGLSIAKGLVELMNGRIWFDSETGVGSTLYFTIPYVQSKMITLN